MGRLGGHRRDTKADAALQCRHRLVHRLHLAVQLLPAHQDCQLDLAPQLVPERR